MDSALRLTLDFAAARTLGRATLTQVPYLRRELAIAAAAMLAADAVAVTAARDIHVLPETFSVWALSAKHAVAEAADELTRRCGTVLATRSVLRDGPGGAGMFQKLQRDCGVIRVIDASATANLRSYAAQLPTLLTREADPEPARAVFALDAELPPYDPTRLDMVVRGGDPGCWAGWRQWRRRSPTRWPAMRARQAPPTWSARQRRRGPGWRPRPGEAISPGADPNALPDLAERYAWLHAAASCIHLWWASRAPPALWLRARIRLVAWGDALRPARQGGRHGSPEAGCGSPARARRRDGVA